MLLAHPHKSFVKYHEAGAVREAKLSVELIQKAMPILSDLRSLSKALSFKKLQMEACVRAALASMESAKGWSFKKDTSREDYIKTMTVRIRNLCYVVATEGRKSKPARWFTDLAWEDGEMAEQTGAAATMGSPLSTKTDEDYDYNWDAELLRYYRVRRGGEASESWPSRTSPIKVTAITSSFKRAGATVWYERSLCYPSGN
jgi:hypothetical protein